MSTALQDHPTLEYAIDDPEILFGELEIFITAPFDAGHIIHLTRQLQKHGCNIRHSSGSFQHGCSITVSMEEPRDILDIIANAPGIRDARISDDVNMKSEEFIGQWLDRIQSRGLGIQRIKVTTEPRKEQVNERLEALQNPNKETVTQKDEEGLAEMKSPLQINEPRGTVSDQPEDKWARRLTFDIRHRSFKR